MKSLKTGLVVLGSVGLILFGACSNSNQAANPDNSPAASPPETVAKTEPASEQSHPTQGGQVIESGQYHLEFVPEKEADGTHLDFFLQSGDNHEAISDAKVTAQIQLPDGTPKTIDMTYDAAGKHYTALLPEKAAGEYKVAILSEVNGEKVNGRFTFNR